eukprot:gb/GECG01002195.1/.p1 GENE.gb/GECG01002195.1/~~gb/GECG01002195.1/.p1  ORF type:complete len:1084 (+),score=66.99 gb/GECG01002195.1/:1-3252(+)
MILRSGLPVTFNKRMLYFFFVAQLNEEGTMLWNRVVGGLASIRKFDDPEKAVTQMPDSSLITGINWRSILYECNCILLIHWEANGEIRQAAVIRNKFKNVAVFSLNHNDGFLYVGIDEGLLSLPYWSTNAVLLPEYWFIPDSPWEFEDVVPYAYSLHVSMSFEAHQYSTFESHSIPTRGEDLRSLPGQLRPYPKQATPPLLQKAKFGEHFSVDLLEMNSEQYGSATLKKMRSINAAVWLNMDFINHSIYGIPTGTVRGLYSLDFDLEYSFLYDSAKHYTLPYQFLIRYRMVIDVPNQPPYYSGPTTLRFWIDGLDISNVLLKHVWDPENDTITSYGLALYPRAPPWLVVDPKTGIISATMISGYQGNYTANVTAIDSFGGIGSKLLTINVPNRSPNISIGDQYVYVDNIYIKPLQERDPDGDRIYIQSTEFENRGPLPDWINLSIESNTFVFSPKTGDQGSYNISLIVKDCFQHPYQERSRCGHSVHSYFAVTVPNRAPVLTRAFGQHTLRILEPWSYSIVDHFKDPDGDTLHYQFSHKPGWLKYSSESQELQADLTSIPNHDVYSIIIQAFDGHGGHAQGVLRLQIKTIPQVSFSMSQVFKFLAVGVAVVSATLCFGNALLRRKQRSRYINELSQLLKEYLASCPKGDTECPSVRELNDQYFNQVYPYIRELSNHQSGFFNWARSLHRYYISDNENSKESVASFLITSQFMEDLIGTIRSKWDKSAIETQSLTHILLQSCYLLLLHHNRTVGLSIVDKLRIFGAIDYLISRYQGWVCQSYQFNRGNLEEVLAFYQLLCTRQAVMSTKDNQTNCDIVLNFASDIVIPSQLFTDAYHLWNRTPNKWYIELMLCWQQGQAIRANFVNDDQEVLRKIQKTGKTETRWEFRFGLIDVYIDLLWHYRERGDMATCDQLTKGSKERLGLVALLTQPSQGCCQWRRYVSCKCCSLSQEYQWVSRYAMGRVNSLPDDIRHRISNAVSRVLNNRHSFQPGEDEAKEWAYTVPSSRLFDYFVFDPCAYGSQLFRHSDIQSQSIADHLFSEFSARLCQAGSCVCQRDIAHGENEQPSNHDYHRMNPLNDDEPDA